MKKTKCVVTWRNDTSLSAAKPHDELGIKYVNDRISNGVCDDTINELKDLCLLDDYHKCKSVQNKIRKLTSVLEKNNIEIDKQKSILDEYILELIPAGTKGVIRGNKFNDIVKDKIMGLNLDAERFEICFEKQCDKCMTTEIPDWYIFEKPTGKVIIGMNQLDLWRGGQQLNRGSKYLFDNKINSKKSKLLCVVCNKNKIH